MTLSDLDLVSQAMASSEPANARGSVHANGTTSTTNGSANTPSTNSANLNPPTHLDTIGDIDLSSLSVEERAILLPIIDALRASDDTLDSLDVEDIMKQLDAAGSVADTIEDRLDSLLAHLGELEAQASPGEEKA
ncbi:hypothetical protein CcaverHIS002_0608520 [Cutaneotrichosporon cavernicola]|uniref:Uncharacterized protein n=1 Tax=Cutaneotrichosporon cavernicola TaxID=279322 RepID=A0AA48L978_9TREE|nr:uncharacterized protein CcaverHIS019_0607980 [Cutaneotrichosporon cavernicola]BEI86565.1 hypothetical protein CcaverHIS002_0608520 [Cutaneotrichosporon cavernicola]BEI94339.1 hypothetical protein CcaverHIS019_0607980 [Cutaneotrichosporon cavernicola]BEJ02116.1 hypothetical protein CcaverHIS631_0607980 [Cutaneotrichosporon cavernicola]BEJ09877.1 hypothetical protein CcaverHIS641_0607920 [Cutaneotrichosporon cavernicola]